MKISRTSCVRPSPTTTRHQELTRPEVTRSSSNSRGTTRRPSTTLPLASRSLVAPSGTPLTFASYSRNTP
jgi:hypothetical protein